MWEIESCVLYVLGDAAVWEIESCILYVLGDAAVWEIAFKATNGTQQNVRDVWSNAGWHDGGAGCTTEPDVPCSKIYKSPSIDNWNTVKQVCILKCKGGTA